MKRTKNGDIAFLRFQQLVAAPAIVLKTVHAEYILLSNFVFVTYNIKWSINFSRCSIEADEPNLFNFDHFNASFGYCISISSILSRVLLM